MRFALKAGSTGRGVLRSPPAGRYTSWTASALLPPPAVPTWATVAYAEPAAPDANGPATLREAGADFFQAAAEASDAHGTAWTAFIAALRGTTGRKGPALFDPSR